MSFAPFRHSMRNPQYSAGRVENFGPLQPRGQGTASASSSSSVPTTGPFSQGHMRQYGRPQPASRQSGSGAGARTQGAFAQAAAQQAGNQYRAGMEDANLQSQQNLEKVRSGDIFSQRSDQVRRYGMDKGYEADKRGIQLSQQQDLMNVQNRLREDMLNQRTNRQMGVFNNLLGGGLLSSAANARIAAQGGQPFFSNNLLGSAIGGMSAGQSLPMAMRMGGAAARRV
jgi:hypothetical protein